MIESRPGTRSVDPIPEIPKPVLDPLKPVASQCRELLLQEGGSRILAPLFSSSIEIRKLSALLLGDLVHYGNVSIIFIIQGIKACKHHVVIVLTYRKM